MDKLQEIENRYIINNKFAWSSYIDLVEKEHLSWLIETVKVQRRVRISQGCTIIQLSQELEQAKIKIETYEDAIKGAAVITNIAGSKIKSLEEENKNLIAEIQNFKTKTRFRVYEENLELAQQLNAVNELIDRYERIADVKKWSRMKGE